MSMVHPKREQLISSPCVVTGNSAHRDEWNAYVKRSPNASLFHRWEWGEAVKAGFGHETFRLVARRDREIVGVASFVDVKSPLFGRSLIATGFSVGGGLAADDDKAEAELAAAAIAAGKARGVNYVELRGEKARLDGWHVKDDIYAVFRKKLAKTSEERFSQIPRRRRAEIRKGLAAVDEGQMTIAVENDVDIFYGLYAEALRNLGTPVFSKSFIKSLINEFSDDAEILVARAEGVPVVALVTFYHQKTALPYFVGGTMAARDLRAFDLVYWTAMERAAARGAEVFDFGRSKVGSPHYAYKGYWGFEPTPLEYQYALIKAKDVPNVNPENPKFQLATTVWKRLPLSVANRLGPVVARNLA